MVPLSLDDARRIVTDYVAHYDNVRLHSAIGYVTPKDRLEGRHTDILAQRDRKLVAARERRKLLRQLQHPQPAGRPRLTRRQAIDFTAVRAAITMAAVLDLLGFQARTKHGAQQRGPCPLHGSTSATSRCFSVNLDDQIFHCFKCGRSGNALDLWAQASRQTPYDAARDLCQRLNIALPSLLPQRNREEETVASGSAACTMEST